MSYTLVKIAASNELDDDDFLQQPRGPSHFIRTEAFTVLPPLSPQIPGPPPTPSPYRILPPIVSRRRPSFVILQELGSRPPSRDPSPSGRVSPFRGYGFKASSLSQEPSPSRPNDKSAEEETSDNEKTHRSRSRLPVALRKPPTRKVSKSVSPARSKSSGIPVPLNRRISCSPNRTKEIMNKVNIKSGIGSRMTPLKSSENLLGRQPAVSESDLKSALRKSKMNATRSVHPTFISSPKPLVKQKPKTAVKLNVSESLNAETSPLHESKKAASAVTSPARRNLYLGKNETLKKNEEKAGKEILVRSAPTRPKTLPKSPSKIVSAKSKENLSPCSKPPPFTKVVRSPSKMTKTPSKPPLRTPMKEPPKTIPTENVEGTAAFKLGDCGTHCDVRNDATSNTTTKTVNNETEKVIKPPKALPKRVGHKALTTSNLLAAMKKAVKETTNKIDEVNGEVKVEGRKDLPHMDTSRSLPITIGTSNMTNSSVALIQTTTEPALAPVEPDFVTEIRSALNDAKNVMDEKTLIQQEVKNVDAAETGVAGTVAAAIVSLEGEKKSAVEVKEIQTQQMGNTKDEFPPLEDLQSRSSPHPIHVIAVNNVEEPKQEVMNTIIEIKQEADNEVQTVNTSNPNKNWNGISKSSWLNEGPRVEIMRKSSVRKLKQNPSTECLMSTNKPSRWQHLRSKCPKCLKKTSDTHLVQISTITKTATDPANMPVDVGHNSCLHKYLCCFCGQCTKSKKGEMMVDGHKRKCRPQFRCFRLKNDFRNMFSQVSCCKKKTSSKFSASSKTDSEVACVGPQADDTKTGSSTHFSSKFFKCLGILCCINSAFCLKMRDKFDNWCSCCKKCVCCGNRKKKVITEAERRRSTISVPRKRKWTRFLTDFPKLDASFVEHGSLMRGAIPVLPVPLAWICLILNVFLPGFGTLSSGIFCLFVGKPRFSTNDSIFARIGAFVVNLLVAGSQLFTVLFCLVGWGWSIWWGVMMLRMAKKNKRIFMAEQGTNSMNLSPMVAKNRDPEKGVVSHG